MTRITHSRRRLFKGDSEAAIYQVLRAWYHTFAGLGYARMIKTG
jgi:hypothetical protein